MPPYGDVDGGERLSYRVREDLVDFGDVDSMDAGGVGIDADSDLRDDAAGLVAFAVLLEAFCEPQEEDDDPCDDESFSPHEARTLFSTLTVSSLNISES